MRKLFRFKYEPCNRTCYAWCEVLPRELNRLPAVIRTKTINMMVEAHAKLCDNPDYSFGIDQDDRSGLFVGHFRSPAGVETVLHYSLAVTMRRVYRMVMAADIPKLSGDCTYGDTGSEDLGREILRACTDPEYLKAHHAACPCQLAAA